MAEKSSRRRPRDEDDDDRPKKRRRYEPDDADSDEDRASRKKKAARGSGMLLFVILGAGGLILGMVVLVIVLALPRSDDQKGVNVDKTPNPGPGVAANPAGGFRFKLAHKESTSFEVTFKQDHLIEVHSFAPVLITVTGANGREILGRVERGGFLAFKKSELCKVIVANNSIGAADGVLEIKQTPLNPIAEPTEKNKIAPSGGPFDIPLDVPVYTLSGKGTEVNKGQGKWVNSLSPNDARLPTWKLPYKLFQVEMKAGMTYSLEVRSGEFSTSIHKYDPAGRHLGATGTPLFWSPKESGRYRFAVTANEKGGEGLFVVSMTCFKSVR